MSLIRRCVFSALAVIVASFIIYVAVDALPGDYATATLGRDATPAHLALMRKQLGLDRPVVVRWADWATSALHGDFGNSYTGESVMSLIEPRAINSLALALTAMLFTIPIAIFLGVVSGFRASGMFDGAIGAITLVAISLPEFVVGLFLAAGFGILLPILPATSIFPADSSAFSHPRQLVLPAAAAAGVTIGYIARMTRAATLDVLDSDYIRAAKLRGIPSRVLFTRHVVRNALIPAVTVIGNNVAWMLTGLVAVELVFVYPGLGSLLVNAITTRDAPLISAICLIITIAFIAVNLLTDLVALLLNPPARARN